MSSNVNGALGLTQALNQFNQISSLINLSSISVYGEVQCECLNEDHLFYNSNLYGASKLAVEVILDSSLSLHSRDPLNLWHLRLPGIVGEGSYTSSKNFISSVKQKLSNNIDLFVMGDSHLFNNIIHIDTLIEIIIFLTKSSSGRFSMININICLDPLPIKEVINYMKDSLHSKSK